MGPVSWWAGMIPLMMGAKGPHDKAMSATRPSEYVKTLVNIGAGKVNRW